MPAVNDNNFITIQGWMRTKLNLKGNELLVYALIYGFSQDGQSRFKGSRKYIADWCGCSLNTVDRALGSLVDKGFLAKYPHTDAYGNRLVDYVALHPTAAAAPAPSAPATAAQAPAQDPWADATNTNAEQFQTPDDEAQPLIAEPEPQPQPKKTRKAKSFDDIIDAYTSDPETKDLLGAWLQNRKAKHSAMTDRAIQGNIKKLDQYAQASHMSVNDYLNEVICRGWGSFFIIDNYKRTGYQKPQQQPRQPSWTPTEEERRQQEEADNYFLNNCVF
ncbi:MAG: Replication initiator protein A (RepA) N-terminus [Namikivirus ikeda]|uniref:Replication initiator protein A (RepA) N-terminus n=1 Tax=Bacteriophage sp. TaxID=38018 RepID=A0ABY5TSA0_9VIRU|nr:MAG: Replication initiator protein A (RepA) N-terminus [Bacteriophage sp.]